MEYTPKSVMDMIQLMENSIRLIKQVELTHKGLGVGILFVNLCAFAGVSLLLVGEKGEGKTRVIKSTRPYGYNSENIFSFDTTTMKEIIQKIGIKDSQSLYVKIEDFSTLSAHHREIFLTWFSKIITDHNFTHSYGVGNNDIEIKITNCDLTICVGITPMKYAKLTQENEYWESIASDRFLKFLFLNPIRKKSLEMNPQYQFSPVSSGDSFVAETDTSFNITNKLLFRQITRLRTILYSRKLIKAYCRYEGYEKITMRNELEFKKLFEPYLRAIPDLTYIQNLEDNTNIAIGAIRLLSFVCDSVARDEPTTLTAMTETFGVYNKLQHSDRYLETLRKHIQILTNHGLITYETIDNDIIFHLGEKLQKYFSWYRGL